MPLIRPLAVTFALLTALTGFAYPALVTAVGAWLDPAAANGSLVARDGITVGSALIGQSFQDPRYFWGRLSATAPMPDNGAASGGSNFGPLNPALGAAAQARVAALKLADPDNARPIPVDLATASGSGLDPEVSPAAILYQVGRVARARNLDPEVVRRLALGHVEGRQWGVFGEPRVNVLMLNLDLDRAQ